MTTIQKRAYKYDQLADLDNKLVFQIDRIYEDQKRYEDQMKEMPAEEWVTSWQKDEYDTNKEKIEVLKTLRKDLEKL